jgi:hypothetical protein
MDKIIIIFILLCIITCLIIYFDYIIKKYKRNKNTFTYNKYSKNKSEKALYYLYKALYKNSTPSANFNKLVKEAPFNKDGQKVVDYMSYIIDRSLFDKLIEKYKKKFKLNEFEEKSYLFNAYLGPSPRSTDSL